MNHLIKRSRRNRRNGFTLMELLIVISIIVILLLLAVPNFLQFRMRANETSAMNSIQAIYKAQYLYTQAYPSVGFACGLPALGGEPGAASTQTASSMLSGDLASGTKDGYNFTISCPQKSSDSAANAQFKVTAVPATVGRTGTRGFCMDESGTMMADPAGGANCSQLAK
jgi:type IV pilus assembly protein PilA